MYANLDSYSRTQVIPPITRPKINDWVGSFLKNGWNLVVDGADKRIIAHAAAVLESAARHELVIFVHQSVRNSGIGTELLKHLVAHAAHRNRRRSNSTFHGVTAKLSLSTKTSGSSYRTGHVRHQDGTPHEPSDCGSRTAVFGRAGGINYKFLDHFDRRAVLGGHSFGGLICHDH